MRDLVIFVCTANICRSPMAEKLLQHALAAEEGPVRDLKVASAGIAAWAGEKATPNAQNAIRKVGLDLSIHKSQPLTQDLVDRALAIFCMTEGHREAILTAYAPLPPYVHLVREFIADKLDGLPDVADPYGQNLAVYEECRDEIMEAIPSIISFLKQNRG